MLVSDYGFLIYTRSTCMPPTNPLSLASQGRRLDISARILVAAYGTKLPLVPKIVSIYIDDNSYGPCLIRIEQHHVNELLFEKTAATLLIKILRSRSKDYVSYGYGFRDAILLVSRKYGLKPVLLSEEGRPLYEPIPGGLYILGAEIDPPRNIVEEYPSYSIGPYLYLASHVVAFMVFLHNTGSIKF